MSADQSPNSSAGGPDSQAEQITLLLETAGAGDKQAAADLLPLVYDELRRLAAVRLAKLPPGQTLQPTALVHEAYMKLVKRSDPGWNSRGHFFGAAARAMRDILVDQARRKSRIKHGGDRKQVALESDRISDSTFDTPTEDMLELDSALGRLEKDHPERAEIVMLRYFAGLTNDQVAMVMNVSTRTIERGWRFARAWLHKELNTDLGEPRTIFHGDGP